MGGPGDIVKRSDEAEFTVVVQDANDHAPYFEWNQKTVEVPENAG